MPIEAVTTRIGEIRGAIESLAPKPTPEDVENIKIFAPPIAYIDAPKGGAEFADVIGNEEASRAGDVPIMSPLPAPLAGDGRVDGGDVMSQAEKYLGVPYVFGGEDATGIDCSGLVQRVFADLGIDVPRVVQDQDTIGQEVGSLANAQPGDLIVNNDASHILFYAGDGMVLHAPKPGDHVKLAPNYLTDADISTIRRVVPAEGTQPAVSGTGGGGVEPAAVTSEDMTALFQMFQAQLLSGAGAGASGSQLNLQSLLAGMS